MLNLTLNFGQLYNRLTKFHYNRFTLIRQRRRRLLIYFSTEKNSFVRSWKIDVALTTKTAFAC